MACICPFFEKGVKMCNILNFIMSEPIAVAFRRDGTDMNVWLDIYDESQGNFDYANETQMLDSSYDIKDIPPRFWVCWKNLLEG